MKYELLDSVNSPSDIKNFTIPQLEQLCGELREYIIECCSTNPGHLASSLGAVEIIVALHYVFDAPEDKLVFDVGHQAYAHKILTGRREAFRTLRTSGGISGFPNRAESEYDCFGVGHSSTSISAALGFAEAARMQGLKSKAVAIIGDGAMTGGLAFEGLNNAGASRADLLTILNDNNQSIDNNIGAMHEYLLKITTSSSYNRLKNRIWNLLGDGEFRYFIQRWVRSLKSWFVKKSGGDLFESLGLRYFGPVDGNNIGELVSTLRRIKDMPGPRILHCKTVKGKGYGFAEADPVTWHAPGKFNPETGERQVSAHDNDRYQDDDVALQSLPVVLCFDRAGLVGEDGSTHNGVFDIAAYRNIPGAVIASPKDELELKQLMYTAYRQEKGPFIIRYPRGMGKGIEWRSAAFSELEPGKAECLLEGSEVAIVCTGPVAYEALEAAKACDGKVGVYNFRFIKPLDCTVLDEIAGRYDCILTVEDGCLKGGLYGAVCEYIMEKGLNCAVQGIGVPDEFIKHARQADQLAQCGIGRKGIEEKLENIFKNYLQNNK